MAVGELIQIIKKLLLRAVYIAQEIGQVFVRNLAFVILHDAYRLFPRDAAVPDIYAQLIRGPTVAIF